MARYRKGDKYLSEEEYRKEQESSWMGFLFLVGAGLIGYYVSTLVSDLNWPKWLRFTSVIIAGLIGGGLLSVLHKQVSLLLSIAIFLSVVFLIGSLIWVSI